MASSDIVNYSIRPSKAIERKLVFEVLSVLSRVLNVADYRYIGLGAPWFIDFVMAHKILSISDMVSIEQDEVLATRAEFNKPYACVKVIHGDSQTVLPDLAIEEKSLLAWLDYDTSLEGPVLEDLSTLCRKAPVGSIILVTVNAHKNRLPEYDEDDNPYETFEDKVRAQVGKLAPPVFPKNADQTSAYPPFLASLLFTHMHRQLLSAGRTSEFLLPLFNIGYQDNAPMISVGGMIVDEDQKEQVRSTLVECDLGDFLEQKRHLKIRVPPLTLKEKTGLDQLLPRNIAPTANEVREIGFALKPSQIDAYCRFYRHYPTFGEVVV